MESKGTRIEILAYEETPLGPLCLRRRPLASDPGTVVTEITLDHEFLMSSYNTASEEALASLAVAMHGGDDLDVLVGGLGLGYTAREVLRSDRVRSVEVIEYLPQVVSWLEQELFPLAPELRADSRFSVTHGDVYRLLAQPAETTYDLILIDVDHSPDDRLDDSSGSFYTEAGLRAARGCLRQGGILAVWSYAEDSPFAQALAVVFSEVRIEPVRVENSLVDENQTDWLFLAR